MSGNISSFAETPRDRVPLEKIIGRDALAAKVFNALTEQSVVLTAERRMGKTWLLFKMRGEANLQQQNWVTGWVCLYQDLSGYGSPAEFAQGVLQEAEKLLGLRKRALLATKKFLSNFQEVKLPFLQIAKSSNAEWKTILRSIFADLAQQLPGDRIVFLWDEFPVMLDTLIHKEGNEGSAQEILNLLHALRSEFPQVRMILTGSVGLHHVMKKLRQDGYNNPVTNDMRVLSVPPLAENFATEMARSLLVAKNIQVTDLDATALAIAQEVDCIPFYIREVIERCVDYGLSIDGEAITKMVRASLTDADNSWHMSHYLERIAGYYGVNDCELVRSILDVVADAGQRLTTADITQALQQRNPSTETISAQLVRDLLTLLERDNYLAKDPDTLTYGFRYGLIRRYWQLQRA
jgi:hypothetical protein